VEDLVRRLNVSTRQFERLFRLAVGTSPATYYRTLRLRYGHWLLRNTKRSVTAIANEAGFADCAHFSRQFRELFGISPSEVRRTAEPDAEADPHLSPLAAFRRTNGDSLLPDRRLFEDPAPTAQDGVTTD
jgi:AraC-like DNA-binding protein